MFGKHYACWGVCDFGRAVESAVSLWLDFESQADQRALVLGVIPHESGGDFDDLLFLARIPQRLVVHRPDLAVTNGWWLCERRDSGVRHHFVVVGT
jgi:hypothetical protein